MASKFAGKTEHRRTRSVLIVLSLGMIIFGLGLFLIEPFRAFIIYFAEKNMVFRLLNHTIWDKRLIYGSVSMLVFGVSLLGICLCGALEIIIRAAKKIYVYVKTGKIPQPVKYFSFLCLFLLLYAVSNVNIMFIVFCYTIWKLNFYSWLKNTFGRTETKTAFVLAGTAVLFFMVIMLLFRAAIVMDVLFGDSNRVLEDFTEVSSNHYRAKVHPFYVLIWQSLYHLFSSPENTGSIAIRAMVAVFAGLNVGLFSLFVSRLTKSRLLNILLCAVMAFSFPQIYHGSQMLESFIFTQTSVLLMIVYFSFAFSQKEYRLTPLLAVSLFVAGNNIAYICLFGIFFIFLLWNTSEALKQAAQRFFVFAAAFIAGFSVLLLLQSLFYGKSAPSNIISMIREILSEEGAYITAKEIVSWPQYAKNFFNVIIFEYLPLGFGNIFDSGWVWSFSLLLPFVLLKKIKTKRLFQATASCCLFLVFFHGFYGSTELPLYAPVITGIYLCFFAFIAAVLPKKFAVCVCGTLLAVMIPVNSIGTYTLHRIDHYVFGSLDSGNGDEYQENITSMQKIISSYRGNKLLFYRNVREENGYPQTPLHDEIRRAHENNDIDITMLPFAEANKAGKVFFFGLENRRKLVFEKAVLRDFKTNEILYSFPNAEITVRPWDFSVSIIDKKGSTYLIQETTEGVFVDGVLVEGTGEEGMDVIIPDFSNYKYPLIMKVLYHEIMFSMIDGVPYARLFDYFHNEKGEPQKIVWYRDAAYAGLFLEFIGRADLIERFAASIHELYDQNRDVKEPDNLGQILYLQSLAKNRNNDLIKAIVEEADRIKDSDGNLRGTTDGSRSSAYQNGWLIFGLERLGMYEEAARFNRRSEIDDNGYSQLLWFTLPQNGENRHTPRGNLAPIKINAKSQYTNADNQPFPYINIGKDHFAMRAGMNYKNPILTQVVYPITWGDDTRPHIWHSVELFMYCAEFQNR